MIPSFDNSTIHFDILRQRAYNLRWAEQEEGVRKESIPGGLTGLMREKIMPDGGLIISLYPNAWKTVCRTQRF